MRGDFGICREASVQFSPSSLSAAAHYPPTVPLALESFPLMFIVSTDLMRHSDKLTSIPGFKPIRVARSICVWNWTRGMI